MIDRNTHLANRPGRRVNRQRMGPELIGVAGIAGRLNSRQWQFAGSRGGKGPGDYGIRDTRCEMGDARCEIRDARWGETTRGRWDTETRSRGARAWGEGMWCGGDVRREKRGTVLGIGEWRMALRLVGQAFSGFFRVFQAKFFFGLEGVNFRFSEENEGT